MIKTILHLSFQREVKPFYVKRIQGSLITESHPTKKEFLDFALSLATEFKEEEFGDVKSEIKGCILFHKINEKFSYLNIGHICYYNKFITE